MCPAGVAMPLRLSVEEGALIFRSSSYGLRLGRFRMPLPRWLSPGALSVTHRETGADAFEFALNLQHSLFGELLRQSGRYRDQDA
jgi:hypothetical protein